MALLALVVLGALAAVLALAVLGALVAAEAVVAAAVAVQEMGYGMAPLGVRLFTGKVAKVV